MNVLLLGASSYLGARVYMDLRDSYNLTGTYSTHNLNNTFTHLDITDEQSVVTRIKILSPNVIIHSANNANPVWCESHPKEAVLVNQTSMNHIIRAASEVNAAIIYISSFSAVDDTTVYGRTKYASEEVLKSSGLRYCILRPSLIVGMSPNTTSDRSFNRMLSQIEAGKPVKYDTEWKFQPTYIAQLSGTIHEVMNKNLYGHTIHVASKEIVSRYTVCSDILSPFGISVKPIQKSDHGVILMDSCELLSTLKLPEYSYAELIQNIIDEIHRKGEFVV